MPLRPTGITSPTTTMRRSRPRRPNGANPRHALTCSITIAMPAKGPDLFYLASRPAGCRSLPATPTPAHHHAVRQLSGPRQPGPSPQLHPGRVHGLRHLTQPSSPAATEAARDARHCRIEGVWSPAESAARLRTSAAPLISSFAQSFPQGQAITSECDSLPRRAGRESLSLVLTALSV
jgi:hypothetical protein